MHLHPAFIVALMMLCVVAGGLGLKQFSVTRDILWLVSGFCLYGLSNVFFILTIDQTGLARAMVIAAAAQIVLTSTIAFFVFGERIGPAGWLAAALACLAVIAASLDRQPTTPTSSPTSEFTQEADDANRERCS